MFVKFTDASGKDWTVDVEEIACVDEGAETSLVKLTNGMEIVVDAATGPQFTLVDEGREYAYRLGIGLFGIN